MCKFVCVSPLLLKKSVVITNAMLYHFSEKISCGCWSPDGKRLVLCVGTALLVSLLVRRTGFFFFYLVFFFGGCIFVFSFYFYLYVFS